MTAKMVRNYSEDGESASYLSTNDFRDGDWLHVPDINNDNERPTETSLKLCQWEVSVLWESGCNRIRSNINDTQGMTSEKCPCIQPSLLLSAWCAESVYSVCM